MPILNLFEECLNYTVSGIKNLKLCAKSADGSPINFPIDVVIKNGDEATIMGEINEENQTLTIGNQTMQYVEPNVENSSFSEVETKDRRGNYYTTTIKIDFSKVQLYTNNQLKDFLFTNKGEFAIAKVVYHIIDNNDVQWLGSYDLPAIVDNLTLTTGGNDNFYTLTLIAKSYVRIRHFEEIVPDYSFSLLPSNYDFGNIDQ